MTDLGLYFAGGADGWTSYERPRAWVRDNDSFRRDILARLADSGPLTSRDIPDTCAVPWASTGWTHNRNVTQMLEFLMRRGEVAISAGSGASGCGTWQSGCTRPTSSSRRSRTRRGSGTSGGYGRWASPGGRPPRCPSSPSTSATPASRPSSRAYAANGASTPPCSAATSQTARRSSPVRPAHPRPRPRPGALRLRVRPRDVQTGGQAALGLLRAADPPRRPDGGQGRRRHRPQGRRPSSERDPRGRQIHRAIAKAVQAELDDLAGWLGLETGATAAM